MKGFDQSLIDLDIRTILYTHINCHHKSGISVFLDWEKREHKVLFYVIKSHYVECKTDSDPMLNYIVVHFSWMAFIRGKCGWKKSVCVCVCRGENQQQYIWKIFTGIKNAQITASTKMKKFEKMKNVQKPKENKNTKNTDFDLRDCQSRSWRFQTHKSDFVG